MTVSVGDKLPDGTLKHITPNGAKDVSVTEFFGGRKIVLFGIPGAFTPTCSTNHLPGFVENHGAIIEKGIDAIAVISLNDHHVMTAWARYTGAEGKIEFLADGNGTYIRAIGMEADMSPGGLGNRCKRFSMIVDNGAVKELNTGDKPGQAEITGAARILEQLG